MSENIFNDILGNLEELKIQYSEFLTPFFSYKSLNGKREWRKMIYELPIRYECKEWIWQALNGDIIIEDFFEEE